MWSLPSCPANPSCLRLPGLHQGLSFFLDAHPFSLSSPTPIFWFQPAFVVPFQCHLFFEDFLEPRGKNLLFFPSSP